ncbi:hypothetical protein PMG71_02670 [Roseofilum sp. BLCC_M154]|uniref:Uncharacterized protein n=1 Tax=Roseofilum acuticapitatum BLCC-M154 TaxID=3022444 RepID=A0ABT7AN57_9CYAN|nr:hypothetical protein [Roseofilum acuticapitatum]MDJ1168325.1 hypothetical protein [Roseofilum acuticapitatum BLCC-M154]
MQKETWGLLLKVLSASLLISWGIKYGLSWLPLAATSINALILILLPTLAMSIVFAWRGFP